MEFYLICVLSVLSRQVLESASVAEVEYMIKLEITLGKANANIHKAAESVKAYQTALRILEESLVAEEMKDRSIVFPIFSGLFIALKLGMIKQDPDFSFEKSLAARFVKETKSHGDPVHYLRALAMEAEIYGRLGEFDLAFKAKREMERIYDPDKHTHAISQIYGSDRTAQAIGLSSLWYYQTGRMKEALHNCDRVMSFVLPRMDIHNVHNSFLIIIPSLWVMKENGLAHEAAINFEKYVAEPFHLFYPEGAFTYFLPVFKPIAILLDLASYSEIENQRAPDFNEYLEWALEEANLRPSSIMNSMGVLGRVPGTITSEICLLLAEKLEYGPDRMTLVKSGLAVASEALDYVAVNEMVSAEKSTQAIYDKLKQLDITPRYGCL
jgi:tetratricopeptide (TPR) repeat protein